MSGGCEDLANAGFITHAEGESYGMESMTTPDKTCPFCEESGFDLIGLKSHITYDCHNYSSTSSVQRIFAKRCNHEWFEGRCVHCDITAVNGRPKE